MRLGILVAVAMMLSGLVAVVLSCLVAAGDQLAMANEMVDWMNGNQLFEACQQGDRLCFGYILGVTASAQIASSVCIPSATVTSQQLTDVVKLSLRDHPETRHESASVLVLQALKEKFPCN
jgi:hypothetical protein